MHAVDIQIALQMIDFMLKNPRVPAGGLDAFGLAAVIKALHAHAARTWDQGKKSRQAQTAFEKFHGLIVLRAVQCAD